MGIYSTGKAPGGFWYGAVQLPGGEFEIVGYYRDQKTAIFEAVCALNEMEEAEDLLEEMANGCPEDEDEPEA